MHLASLLCYTHDRELMDVIDFQGFLDIAEADSSSNNNISVAHASCMHMVTVPIEFRCGLSTQNNGQG